MLPFFLKCWIFLIQSQPFIKPPLSVLLPSIPVEKSIRKPSIFWQPLSLSSPASPLPLPRQTTTFTTKAPLANTTSSADDPPSDLEFRSSLDDAWYTARVVLEESTNTLVVEFDNFYNWNDKRFSATGFPSAKAVDEFLGRVRPLSQQLQDDQCSRVFEGMTVCALFKFENDETPLLKQLLL
ncbi:uncharacterized protein LOC131323733 [Rhododendron vialii]|uniref:uncharacterized protein LOC131323733 n=1 Tax=Rhododendron vialii TaxID=182163 RepID=UPI00265EDA89|nr:uncharacterized protein LOC131323733 [Rhododendron vialii]